MANGIKRASSSVGILLILLSGVPMPAATQQAVVPLQLSFSDPGARSMGFGGAFVALADDATAALANPAGLVQLLKPEVSIEARGWSYSTPYTVGGRAEGLPSGIGLDTNAGLAAATSEHDTIGLSFLSVAYPKGNWSLALYLHEYANLKFSGETQGLFGGGSDCCQTRIWDQRSTSDLDVRTYGFSAAYQVSERFSVGFGIVYYDSSITATTQEFLWDGDTPDDFFEPSSYLPDRSVRSERLFVDDTGWAPTAGFLWMLSESWRIGGVYREGFETSIGTEVRAGQAVDFGVPPGEVIFQAGGVPLDFPDIYGLGFAYRSPDGRLTVSFQWDRVEYSDIPLSIGLDSAIDDADELHLGAEYVFISSTPVIAIRVGTWLEPDHQMRTTQDEPFARALLPAGNDEIHYSAGLGVAMQRFQIDAAVDFADRLDTVSLSAIYNF